MASLPAQTPTLVVPTAPADVAGNKDGAVGDGGFLARLSTARGSYAVHGVPGSDTPLVAGIRLIDPASRGIGAMMRRAQRLFGVTNRHCIDVDVWRHLTPQELSARHISPADVDRIDKNYDCNRPLGLSF